VVTGVIIVIVTASDKIIKYAGNKLIKQDRMLSSEVTSNFGPPAENSMWALYSLCCFIVFTSFCARMCFLGVLK